MDRLHNVAMVTSDMTSDLRDEDGIFSIPGQYMYGDGMVLGDFAPRQQIDAIKEMEVYNTDVFIASYPKTGTTLTQEITYLIRHHGDKNKSNADYNYNRIPHLESTFPEHTNGLKLVNALEKPRHIKTHLTFNTLPKDIGKAKIIYPMRNPKDTLVSYFHYYRSTTSLGRFRGSWDEFFEMFLSNNMCYGNIYDHYLGYWKNRNDENILFLKYEDLVRHPYDEIVTMAQFLNVELTEKEIGNIIEDTSFGAMKANPKVNYTSVPEDIDPNVSPFMRKGKPGNWRNYFTVAQSELMDQITASRFRGTGLTFDYE